MFVRPKRPSLSFDMAPLIDVVFQLLIFFMLSSSFNLPQLSLALPRTGGVPDPSEPMSLVVSVGEDGSIFLNREKIERIAFAARLREHVMESKEIRVFIRMDRRRPYGEFVNLMKEARDAGARQLQIIYEQETSREN